MKPLAYPQLRKTARRLVEEDMQRVRDGEKISSSLEPALSAFVEEEESTLFDCRALPFEFVCDTGEAAHHEMERQKETVKLPFNYCYFEFEDNNAIFARTCEYFGVDGVPEGHEQVEFYYFAGWDIGDEAWGETFGVFENGFCVIDDIDNPGVAGRRDTRFCNIVNDGDFGSAAVNGVGIEQLAVPLLLGVLTLFNEKLVIDQFVPDPAPRLTQRRLKQGKQRVTYDTHVLRVNVPAIRRIARTTPLGKHESPCLHWRRGHERVLHRYSEYESKTWVRKCLVGDPSKGFVSKSYRLVHELPMIEGETQHDQ